MARPTEILVTQPDPAQQTLTERLRRVIPHFKTPLYAWVTLAISVVAGSALEPAIPALFKPQSTLEGTRAGKKSCKLSMPSASAEPNAKVNPTAGKCLALRCSARATMKPKGA